MNKQMRELMRVIRSYKPCPTGYLQAREMAEHFDSPRDFLDAARIAFVNDPQRVSYTWLVMQLVPDFDHLSYGRIQSELGVERTMKNDRITRAYAFPIDLVLSRAWTRLVEIRKSARAKKARRARR